MEPPKIDAFQVRNLQTHPGAIFRFHVKLWDSGRIKKITPSQLRSEGVELSNSARFFSAVDSASRGSVKSWEFQNRWTFFSIGKHIHHLLKKNHQREVFATKCSKGFYSSWEGSRIPQKFGKGKSSTQKWRLTRGYVSSQQANQEASFFTLQLEEPPIGDQLGQSSKKIIEYHFG